MAELMVRDGTWSFDGDRVWIVPGQERGVHRLRQDLGETSVPLEALAGIAYEPARKGGRLRLRLRDGADPLLHVTGGSLPDDANPYQVSVDPDRTGVAEYFADEVRQSLLLDQVVTGPTDRYLLPGPAVPLSAAGVDGVATFDGERVRIDWRWTTSESKKHAGARDFALADLAGVDWRPASGLESGYLRFRPKGVTAKLKPEHDPNAIELWGFKKESGRTALLAAAVAARLPHPSGGSAPTAAGPVAAAQPAPALKAAAPAPQSGGQDADVLLRRLRELGELHRDGILTAEEFATAKAAVLKGFHGAG
ncbi:DUF4429 domain-containing protein [Streptomyces chrestomyceticus]|uniref:DUF4429 domain-containing protein n=1 Tax=Streptomyces chrestomyceticus TaxID=68185 RepID=A0ABU7WUV6_9ACTN